MKAEGEQGKQSLATALTSSPPAAVRASEREVPTHTPAAGRLAATAQLRHRCEVRGLLTVLFTQSPAPHRGPVRHWGIQSLSSHESTVVATTALLGTKLHGESLALDTGISLRSGRAHTSNLRAQDTQRWPFGASQKGQSGLKTSFQKEKKGRKAS